MVGTDCEDDKKTAGEANLGLELVYSLLAGSTLRCGHAFSGATDVALRRCGTLRAEAHDLDLVAGRGSSLLCLRHWTVHALHLG